MWNSSNACFASIGDVVMGRVGRGSVEGTWSDLTNRYYADNDIG